MFLRELSLTLGAVAAIGCSTSADVVFDSYQQSLSSSVNAGGGFWPAFVENGSAFGQTSQDSTVTSSYFGFPADQAAWGAAEGRFTGNLTSTLASPNYLSTSGSKFFGIQYGHSSWEARNSISQTIQFTLDASTLLQFGLNWTVSNEIGSGMTSGGWQLYDLDQAGGSPVDITNPLSSGGQSGSSAYLGDSITLAAGSYEMRFFTQQIFSGDSLMVSDFSYASNMAFSDAGGGGGGAVPGLGALAPLAAAGLARRRRR